MRSKKRRNFTYFHIHTNALLAYLPRRQAHRLDPDQRPAAHPDRLGETLLYVEIFHLTSESALIVAVGALDPQQGRVLVGDVRVLDKLDPLAATNDRHYSGHKQMAGILILLYLRRPLTSGRRSRLDQIRSESCAFLRIAVAPHCL